MIRLHLELPAGAITRLWLGALTLAALLAAGCGSPGAPSPPSLDLPQAVTSLSASRTDGAVHLAWTMPARTTDGGAIQRPVRAEICRETESGPCTTIATDFFPPAKPATYTDHLPPGLASGAARILIYQVTLRNHAGKSAGPSNSAISTAGTAPAPLTGLTAEVHPDGVLLSWRPAPPVVSAVTGQGKMALDFRIERVLESPPAQGKQTLPSATEPAQQMLVVHAESGPDPGHALDTNAQFNRKYRYTVQRVAMATLGGRTVEIEGQPSKPVTITTINIFPPSVPAGLAAVADAAAGAIDLSWLPDTGQDLAGYYVYRRDVASGLPAARIGPANSSNAALSPILPPAFRDTTAERGHTYAYSVSAVSRAGHESLRSPEVVETLPGQ